MADQKRERIALKLRELIKKTLEPVGTQLTQGVDPGNLALACTLGALIGIFPILGATTTLCIGIGFFFRLNHAVLQAVNYLLYPLQLLALPIFLKVGTRVFGGEPIEFDFMKLKAEFVASIPMFLSKYGMVGLKAVGVWFFFACLLGGPLFFVLRKFLISASQKIRKAA